jgi:type III restriction enzyme
MATGSGKTKVMSLTIAWQFFNAVAEARDDFAKTFLMIASQT